ncbi:hypothetical protein [Neobacillus niacini]|uniref:hypothetical protein n=1 Tax=Neobacillus niacini TaxID=86668 RepID=UPI0021CB4620|nr:hypothetical protein [Neobacillus niacini]MCM3763630.1 hypothetical protein [Neobacillus niacini]
MGFYKSQGFGFIQFIPCMDFQSQNPIQSGKYLITPQQYGDFLCEVFDIWHNNGNPEISVRFFDNMLAVYLHKQAEACIHQKTCPEQLSLNKTVMPIRVTFLLMKNINWEI